MGKTKFFAALILFLVFVSYVNFSSAQGCVKAQPTIVISPKDLSGVGGSTVAYDIYIKNNDQALCQSATFNLAANAGSYSYFLGETSVQLAPGEDKRIMLDVVIPSAAISGVRDITATISSGNYQATDKTQLTIIELPKSCKLSVDWLEVSEQDDNTAKQLFCENLSLKSKTQISLTGDTGTSALAQLYVAGNLFDTKNIILAPNSFAGFGFNRIIDTRSLGLNSFEVKVVVKSSCDIEGDSTYQTIATESCSDKCDFSLSVAKPSDVAVGEKVKTNILVKNTGGADEQDISMLPLLCDASATNECKTMTCDYNDLTLDHGETRNVGCSATADKSGTYKIKLSSDVCDEKRIDYSNDFIISTSQLGSSSCDQSQSGKTRCVGNVVQKSSLKSDCSVEWNDVEYCPFGCSSGSCLSPVETKTREKSADAVEQTSTVATPKTPQTEQQPAASIADYLTIAVLIAIIIIVFALSNKKIFREISRA